MKKPEFKHLFDISLDIGVTHDLGETPHGRKRIVQVIGGDFQGERIKGTVNKESAADWVSISPNDSIRLDVRLTLQTDDNTLIFMRYEGIRHCSPNVAKRLSNNEPVDRDEYYWRTSPFFETGSEKYNWINNVVCFALGEKKGNVVSYNVFELL